MSQRVLSRHLLRGVLAAETGVLITTIGLDPISIHARYAFGVRELLGGVELIPVLIGLFCVARVLTRAENMLVFPKETTGGRLLPRLADLLIMK